MLRPSGSTSSTASLRRGYQSGRSSRSSRACGSRAAPTSSAPATRPLGGPICAPPSRRRAGSRSMPKSGWSISASARTMPRSSARTASARRWSTLAIVCPSSPERSSALADARNCACAAGSSAKAASPDLSAVAAAPASPSTIRARISRVQPSASRGLAASRAARRATMPSIIACCSPAGKPRRKRSAARSARDRGHRGRHRFGMRALISMPMSLATLSALARTSPAHSAPGGASSSMASQSSTAPLRFPAWALIAASE